MSQAHEAIIYAFLFIILNAVYIIIATYIRDKPSVKKLHPIHLNIKKRHIVFQILYLFFMAIHKIHDKYLTFFVGKYIYNVKEDIAHAIDRICLDNDNYPTMLIIEEIRISSIFERIFKQGKTNVIANYKGCFDCWTNTHHKNHLFHEKFPWLTKSYIETSDERTKRRKLNRIAYNYAKCMDIKIPYITKGGSTFGAFI